jgi:hypothetical protein
MKYNVPLFFNQKSEFIKKKFDIKGVKTYANNLYMWM